jgi:hypothetical protein
LWLGLFMSLMLAMAKGDFRIGLFREALVDSVMVSNTSVVSRTASGDLYV